eukprot:TRINITY_DN8091_c0_g2_i1.p1 TRINITY_DN8091_c0_g2~~TRINITY_DN8091_c0_g2_i1.p1  ORF type:complete len:660 (-),score=88.81 TRINITY_DN8091_c0_g2_i1:236-2215(-)
MLRVVPGVVSDGDGGLCPGGKDASGQSKRQLCIEPRKVQVKSPGPKSEDSTRASSSGSPTSAPVRADTGSTGATGLEDVEGELSAESGATPLAQFEKEVSPIREHVELFLGTMQKYAIPLLSGILIAVIWANVHYESYHTVIDEPIISGASVVGHPLTLHFVVNDIFMVFFFGLAIKEVTEALLPGGALNPFRRAMNPLFATVGGVFGPILAYVAFVNVFYSAGIFDDSNCEVAAVAAGGGGHRLLAASVAESAAAPVPCDLGTVMQGWGVPTATDISLAWMGAVLLFNPGHPVVNFLLLLAILDDALGMVIIAVFYPDPLHPVEPSWLALLVGASVLAIVLRILDVQAWLVYVLLCGPIAWLGLLKAHVHPALALVFVVPIMPATHAIHEESGAAANLGACDLGASAPISRDISARSLGAGASSASLGALPSRGSSMSRSSLASRASTMSRMSRPKAVNPGYAFDDMDVTASRGTVASKFNRGFTGLNKQMHAVHSVSRNVQEALHLHNFHDAEAHAPLHQFEANMKMPVDFGMFFFGLANAGVKLGNVGGVTFSVVGALFVGKILGITLMSMLATACGFGLPPGVRLGDILTMSALASIGLTVALFVATEAFPQPALQGEAKMGALLSIGGFGLAFCLQKLTQLCGISDGPGDPGAD